MSVRKTGWEVKDGACGVPPAPFRVTLESSCWPFFVNAIDESLLDSQLRCQYSVLIAPEFAPDPGTGSSPCRSLKKGP